MSSTNRTQSPAHHPNHPVNRPQNATQAALSDPQNITARAGVAS